MLTPFSDTNAVVPVARPLVILEGRQTAIYQRSRKLIRDATSLHFVSVSSAYPVFKKDSRASINSREFGAKLSPSLFCLYFKKLPRIIFPRLIFRRNKLISLQDLAEIKMMSRETRGNFEDKY